MRLAINQPFDLETSLMMGQAFRWYPLDAAFYPDRSQWFSGVLGDNLIHIRRTEDGVEYRAGGPNGATDADLNDLLSRYFRLDDDIEAIYAYLCERDPQMEKLVEDHRGMRVLRQDPWECLVSYICSKSNKITSIRQCVEEIATMSRQTVRLGDDERHIFPTPQVVTAAGVGGLTVLDLKGRFRNSFPPAIYSAAERICNGDLDLDELMRLPYSGVKRELLDCKGIGHKIADCVALMSLDKLDAFPVDTHIKKAVQTRYFGSGKPPSNNGMVQWAQQRFGPYAGYAGQYLFYDRLRNEGNSASHSRQAQQGSLEPDSGAKPARNTSRHQNRSRACPNCGAGIGAVCRYPSGYRYEKGHSERG